VGGLCSVQLHCLAMHVIFLCRNVLYCTILGFTVLTTRTFLLLSSLLSQQAEIASFREDAIRTVQAANACNNNDHTELDQQREQQQEEHCLRGLEKKMLKRPPPNFVKQLLALQKYQKQRRRKTRSRSPGRIGRGKIDNSSDDLATSLQLFSIACSKWARKRAIQLAAEDEFDAYHIFMEGLRKPQQKQHQPYNNAHQDNSDDDNQSDDDEDGDFDADEEFDFCTEGDFVNEIYDYKHRHHDPTEDETEFDDSYDFEDCDFATVPCDGDTPFEQQQPIL